MNTFGSKSLNAIMNESAMMFSFEEEWKDIPVYLLFLSYFIRDFLFIH